MKLLEYILVALLWHVAEASHSQRRPLPTTVLSTGQQFPLVGLEVDGLRGSAIQQRISDAMQNTTQFALFDTAQRANNEKRINNGIIFAVKSSDLHSSEVHVITKVPYTHLGYERTKLAVRESLRNLKNRNTHVHVVLEWPRCDDEVAWMHCEHDEQRLPQTVKAAGPPPHHNKEYAFLDSWRALEEIYLREISLGSGLPALSSIGVANFEVEDLQTLELHSRVLPHVVQVSFPWQQSTILSLLFPTIAYNCFLLLLQKNVWSYIFDPFILEYCHANGVHFQAADALTEIFGKGVAPPRAVGALHEIAQSLRSDDGSVFTPQQVVLKWLVQSGVSVTALATDTAAVHEFSPVSISSIPDLNRYQQEVVQASVTAMLQGQDLPPPLARFHNRLKEGLLHLFWLNEATGEEVPVDRVRPGHTYVSSTYEGHRFVAYADESRTQRREMVVDRTYGQSQRFLIEEL